MNLDISQLNLHRPEFIHVIIKPLCLSLIIKIYHQHFRKHALSLYYYMNFPLLKKKNILEDWQYSFPCFYFVKIMVHLNYLQSYFQASKCFHPSTHIFTETLSEPKRMKTLSWITLILTKCMMGIGQCIFRNEAFSRIKKNSFQIEKKVVFESPLIKQFSPLK